MKFVRWFSLLGLVALLAACNGTPTPATLPDPQGLLKKAAEQVKTSKSFRFKLQLTGAPAFVDTKNTISFISANGNYVAPDRVDADVVARLLGIPGEVKVVAVGERQFMYNSVLTANQWLEMLFSPGFNAQILIQSDKGIESAINSFKDLKMIGQEDLFGTQVYHITGTAPTSDISALTVGLIRDDPATKPHVVADIYINVETGHADRVVLVQPETKTEKDAATTWTLETFDYNASDIKVDIPQAVSGKPGSGISIGPAVPTLGTSAATAASTAVATASK